MKKLLALTLALVMLLSFAACGGAPADSGAKKADPKATEAKNDEVLADEPIVEEAAPADEESDEEPNADLLQYIKDNEEMFSNEAFSVKVVGNSLVFTAKISEFDGLDEEACEEALNAIRGELKEEMEFILSEIQSVVPELESIKVVFCDSEGNEIGSSTIG